MASNAPPRETDPLLPRISRTSETDTSESDEVAPLAQKPSFVWLVPLILLASICKGISMYARFKHYQKEYCPAGNWSTPCGDFSPYFHVPGFMVYTQFTPTFAGFVVSFVSVGWWSQLGDRRGRKMLLLFPIFGTAILDFLFHIVATAGPLLSDDDKRDVLSIGFIAQGLLGGWATYNGAVHAYAFDVAENPLHRLTLFGIIEALFLVGTVAGGAIGTSTHSFPYAYLLSVLLALANLGLTYQFLPESKPPSNSASTTHPTGDGLVASVFLPFTTFFPRGGKALPLLGLASYAYSLTSALDSTLLQYTAEYAYPQAKRPAFLWIIYLVPRICTLLSLVVIVPYLVRRYSKTSPPSSADLVTLPLELTRNSLLAVVALPLVISLFCGRVYSPDPASYGTGAPILYAITASIIPFFSRLPAVGMYALAAAYAERVGRGREVGQLFGALALWTELGVAISFTAYGTTTSNLFAGTYFWALVTLVCLLPNPPTAVEESVVEGNLEGVEAVGEVRCL
ncbi:hypothetical protein C8F01DRAFT_1181360, partial [Mycena amicta]